MFQKEQKQSSKGILSNNILKNFSKLPGKHSGPSPCLRSEAVVRRRSSRELFLKISQILKENTCVQISLLKRDSNTVIFLCNWQNFEKHLFLTGHFP